MRASASPLPRRRTPLPWWRLGLPGAAAMAPLQPSASGAEERELDVYVNGRLIGKDTIANSKRPPGIKVIYDTYDGR